MSSSEARYCKSIVSSTMADENAANETKKRPSSNETSNEDRSTKAARKIEGDDKTDGSNKSNTTTAVSFLDPVTPNPDFSIENDTKKQRFIIYMAIRETLSFSEGLALCKANCDPEIHTKCMQFDGTRHVTMFDGVLTNQQARNLRFTGNFEPFDIELKDGWSSWTSGCYLALTDSSTTKIAGLLKDVEGLAAGGKRPCNHLSLYRKRRVADNHCFDKVRSVLKHYQWGTVQAASIRIKVMGADYRDCKVLAGA